MKEFSRKLTGKQSGLLLLAFVALQLTGCIKDDLHRTPHPGKGAVRVATDWTAASSDAVVPQGYILCIGGKEQAVVGENNAFGTLFEAGRRQLLVYHAAAGITCKGNTAAVDTVADGTLQPLPGYLFTAGSMLDIVKDDTLRVGVRMGQRIRSLTLVLKLAPGDEQRISSTTATLTGIASAVDLATGALVSTEGATVAPVFTTATDRGLPKAATPALTASLRLMGVVSGERQLLHISLALKNGTVHGVTTDLTEMLKAFGGDREPLKLDATLDMPADADIDAGISATITGWNIVDNGEIEIN